MTERLTRGRHGRSPAEVAAIQRDRIVRAMAEALGREVPASKYAPAMELHPILGVAGTAVETNVLAAWNVAG